MRFIKGLTPAIVAKRHKEIGGRFGRLTRVVTASTPLGGWILSLRNAYQLTRGEFGALSGLTDVEITKLERGEMSDNIRLKELRRLGEVLGLRFVYGFLPVEGSPERFDAELRGRLSDLFDDYDEEGVKAPPRYSNIIESYNDDSFIMGSF